MNINFNFACLQACLFILFHCFSKKYKNSDNSLKNFSALIQIASIIGSQLTLKVINWIAYMRALIKRTTNWWNFHVTFSSPPQPYKWKHSSPVSKRLNDTEVLSLSNHFTYNYLVTELSWYEYIFLCIYIHSLNGCDFYSSSRGRSNVYGKANESARKCWNDNWKPQTATITTT